MTANLSYLKWAGGKSKLAPTIRGMIPSEFGAYYEPFFGSGALYFHLYNEQVLRYPRKINLSDACLQLASCHGAVSDRAEPHYDGMDGMFVSVRRSLRERAAEYLSLSHVGRERYYLVARNIFNSLNKRFVGMNEIAERAALFIFLNKTCFNGLWRVNRDGYFNVPWGQHEKPVIYNEEKLEWCSKALSQAGRNVLSLDFKEALIGVKAGDLVYCDPPYIPTSETSSFTAYSLQPFDMVQQSILAARLDGLAEAGAHVIASNSAAPAALKLYTSCKNLKFETVKVRRSISSKAATRGYVEEILIYSKECKAPCQT